MKKMIFLSMACMTLLCAGSCKKDGGQTKVTPGTGNKAIVTFTINGDGYANEPITIQGDDKQIGNFADYGTASNLTIVSVTADKKDGPNPLFRFYLTFSGDKVGNLKMGGAYIDNVLSLTVSKNGKEVSYSSEGAAGGTLKITKYEAVNGHIEGDFTVTLELPGNGKAVKLTNGHFSLTRNEDVDA